MTYTPEVRPELRPLLVGLLAWMLSPVMRLDESRHGSERNAIVHDLLDQTLRGIDSPEAVDKTLSLVQGTEELMAIDEPDPPMSYRTDVVVLLECALKTAQDPESRWLREGVARFEDSLYFLQQAANSTTQDLAGRLTRHAADWLASSDGANARVALSALAGSQSDVASLVTRAMSEAGM